MTDALFIELRQAADCVGALHLGWLVRLGVSWATIDDLSAWGDVPFGVARGCVGDGLFQPGDGPAHIVQPVSDGGALVDLVYWRSADPAQWWLRTGLGWILGSLTIIDAIDDPSRPLMLHSTPLDWLRSGGRGACVLDWRAPEVPTLRHASRIMVPTDDLGGLLRRALTRHLDLPEITVMEEQRYAA